VTVLHDYQVERLTSFVERSQSDGEDGYQQSQSLIAIGSGGLTGRGDDASQTAFGFVPERHTDFVFTVVAERWGFAGATFVLAMYALLVGRGLAIAMLAADLYGRLVAGGIVAMLLFQVFVNVGMNIGIMPITGIPLPLMTYGGSSVLTTFLAFGLSQSIHTRSRT
jgi:rod shape determining protein RodA